MNWNGSLVGEFTECVFFEKTQCVRKNGNCRKRIGPIGSHYWCVTTQHFLVMKGHFKLVKVEPSTGFTSWQIMVEVTSRVTKRMEHSRRFQKQNSRCFCVGNPGIAPLKKTKM